MTPDRVGALEAERACALELCAGFTDEQWHSESDAEGWRVKDVIAHLGASCHVLFTPAAVTLIRTADIEAANDALVERRRNWTPEQILGEYRTWSARVIRLARWVSRTPVGVIRAPLGELGKFRMDQTLTAALVFDHHTHFHHDIAPSLGLAAPPTDANRMTTVVEWMLAVLTNQLRASPPSWLPAPVEITLSGPGGGSWQICPDGSVTDRRRADPIAGIDTSAGEFPAWATGRTHWTRSQVQLSGDTGHAARLLDLINIV